MTSPDPSPDALTEVIDRLYALFSSEPRPTAISGCSHCLSESESSALLVPVPLRDLSADALRLYASDVMSTVGSAADFRYFLPRIIEAACRNEFYYPSLRDIAWKLSIAGWQEWIPEERQAIHDLLHVLWTRTLATGGVDPEEMLDVIQGAGVEVAAYLDEWTASMHLPTAAAGYLQMARFSTMPLDNGFYEANPGYPGHGKKIARWFNGPDVRRAVAAARAATDSEEAAETLAEIERFLSYY